MADGITVDLTDPSGTVYDGSTPLVDADFQASTSTIALSWDVTDAQSGMESYVVSCYGYTVYR